VQLRAVRIHNFRGVLDQTIALRPYSLLVGANNAGKSTIIDAIRAFYEKDGFKFRKDSDTPYLTTGDKESWVELTFQLAADEQASLKEEYRLPDGTVRVRKYLETSEKGADGKSKAGGIYGYCADGTLSQDPFYGAKNVQSGKFGDLIYIPAISKVDEHAKLSGPSALRDLLGEIMAGVVESGTAYAAFRSEVDKFSTAVREEKTADERSLGGFESELNNLLGTWGPQFKLRFQTPSPADMVKSMIGWEVFDSEHKQAIEIDRYGSGFQRHFIYSLITLATGYAGKRATKKTKDFQPNLNLILFEEPEAFLHPSQQEELASSLRRIATDGRWQVLCATHSPLFVSKSSADVPSIACVQRKSGEIAVSQASDGVWKNIIDCNLSIEDIVRRHPKLERKFHPDDARPDMEVLKHFLWLSPDRATMFFARHVLLVEGATELALVNRLVGDQRIKEVPNGLCVVDCLGKFNVHRFMNLLGCLKIQHSAICDDDKDEDHHVDINKLISDSATPGATTRIQFIPGNLEKMLDIPPPKSPHRKPQHVLYLLDSGKIDPARLAAFIDLVEQCLSGAPVRPAGTDGAVAQAS
jgi:hypothetical protein